jgi:antitoxin PrlF
MIISKLTRKARTTIPHPVRTALHLKEGDGIVYRIEGDHVIITQAPREMPKDSFPIFSEWASDADRYAFANL